MACMCGDTHCPSCGPAQGNSYGPHCGMWADDGGCADPEVCQAQEREEVDAMAEDFMIDKLLEEEAKRQGVRNIWDVDISDEQFAKLKQKAREELRVKEVK